MKATRLVRGVGLMLILAMGLLIGVVHSASADPGEPELRYIDPMGELYTQIVEVEANGVRTLYVSGQVGRGETLEQQSISLHNRLKSLLEANGAGVTDIVKLVSYVVDWEVEKADSAFAGLHEIFDGNRDKMPAHTLVGVKALYSPHALMEVEAIAVVAAD